MAFIIKPLVTEKQTKITDKHANRYGSLFAQKLINSRLSKRLKACIMLQ